MPIGSTKSGYRGSNVPNWINPELGPIGAGSEFRWPPYAGPRSIRPDKGMYHPKGRRLPVSRRSGSFLLYARMEAV